MQTWNADDEPTPLSDCTWHQNFDDDRLLAGALSISFEVVSVIDRDKEYVIKDLVDGYRSGITSSPDAWCNERVKFGA
jgi:tRNA-specific 2-thiouridylase